MNKLIQKNEFVLFLLPISFILLLLYFIQKNIMFSPDVSYLLHASQQLLEGGHYGTEIFETNPPMILYLYFPAVLLTKTIFLNPLTAMRIYIISLLVLTMLVNVLLLKDFLGNLKQTYFYALFFSMLTGLCIVPMIAFAQREHLFMILLIPYLLASVIRMENKNINICLAIMVGLFAGLGFSLKPYFLPTFCFVELLFVLKKHDMLAWVRVETVVIISVMMLYLISVGVFEPAYFSTILPLVSKYYFSAIKQSWSSIFAQHYVLYCCMVIVLYPFFIKFDEHVNLGLVIYTALLGAMLAIILPQNAWYYHVLPAWILAWILTVHCIAQLYLNGETKSFALTVIKSTMFVMVLFYVRECYDNFHQSLVFTKANPANKVVEFFSHLDGEHSMTCFTATGTPSCFPMVYQINNSYYQGRFPSFWWYRYLTYSEEKARTSQELNMILADKNHLISMIAHDLNRYHSRWIIIDVRNFVDKNNVTYDVTALFSKNTEFKSAWQNYAYYAEIENYRIYQRIA